MVNVDNITPDIAKELLTILSFCEEQILDSIPDTIMSKLNELAFFSEKEYFIDENKSLKEQNISEECKDLLFDLYNNCIENVTNDYVE